MSLPSSYLQNQRLSRSSRDYYESSHTYWTRVWPFDGLAVAESFTYDGQNGNGSDKKVPLPQLLKDMNRLRMTYAAMPIETTGFSTAVTKLIKTDVSAAEIHVGRLTLHKTGAVTDSERLIGKVFEAPRHALDWASMMGALSKFDPRMLADQSDSAKRLRHIVGGLSESGIVNQPTLGHYIAKKIDRDYLSPTN
jgi:hypothetical protein